MQQKKETPTKPFGWNGISCRVPLDWDVTNLSGGNKQGYFAFDDEQYRRLEIKYDRAKRWGEPDLEKTLNYYFDTIRKKLKKHVPFDVEFNIKLAGSENIPEDRQYLTYGWSSDAISRGIIWYCPVCRRITIAQCMAAPNKANLREMADVLMSAQCHTEGENRLWAVYDFAVEIPERFNLVGQKLQAGLISLTLNRRAEQVVIDRLSMGDTVIKHSKLDEYVKKIHYKKLRGRRLRFEEDLTRGIPGFRIEGERRNLLYYIPYVSGILRKWRKSDHIAGHVWYSEELNRIFVIRTEGKNCLQLADELADSATTYGLENSAADDE